MLQTQPTVILDFLVISHLEPIVEIDELPRLCVQFEGDRDVGEGAGDLARTRDVQSLVLENSEFLISFTSFSMTS